MSQTSDDLSLPSQDAGLLFRAEMAAQNFVLGYWKALVGAVVIGLVGVLLYGQYDSWYKGKQEGVASEIVRVELRAREALGIAAYDPSMLTDEQRASLRTTADELVTIGQAASGPVAAEAHLKAAELYRVLDERDAMRAAYEAALPEARGVVAFAARAGLAAVLVDAGEVDAGIAAWSALATESEGYFGAWATLNLARTQAAANQPDAARASYDQLLARFPESELTAVATDERAALGARASAPAAP